MRIKYHRIVLVLSVLPILACSDIGMKNDIHNARKFINEGLVPSSCILEYNDALVPTSEDACCYHNGGINQCKHDIQCNDLSGDACCLIYATENTTGGSGCCLYADGSTPYNADGNNRTTECEALLSSNREDDLVDRLEAQCPMDKEASEIYRVCAVDNDGNIYGLFGDELTHIPGENVSVAIWFSSGWIPQISDLPSERQGDDVQVFFAPWNVNSDPCCPEDDIKNIAQKYMELMPNGLLWVHLGEDIPSGFEQIVTVLNYGRLFPKKESRPAGYVVRFYME